MNPAATIGQSNNRLFSAFRRYGRELAVITVIAIGILVWHIVPSGVPNVPVAANAGAQEQAAPQVPYYFPSLFINQATATELAPPSF